MEGSWKEGLSCRSQKMTGYKRMIELRESWKVKTCRMPESYGGAVDSCSPGEAEEKWRVDMMLVATWILPRLPTSGLNSVAISINGSQHGWYCVDR